jgi:hypothetical protein
MSEDADLLALMDKIGQAAQDVDDTIEMLGDMIPHRDEIYCDAIHTASAAINTWHDPIKQACAIPAHTEAGRIAKTSLLFSVNDHRDVGGDIDEDAPMLAHVAYSLCCDVLKEEKADSEFGKLIRGMVVGGVLGMLLVFLQAAITQPQQLRAGLQQAFGSHGDAGTLVAEAGR